MTTALDDTRLAAHLLELAARCSPVYRVFAAAAAAPLDPESRAAVSRSFSAIADFAVWQELPADGAALDTAVDTVLHGDPLPPAAFAAAWHDALEASLPDRRSGKVVLHGFPAWVRDAAPFVRPLLAGDLRVLFAHAAALGDAGVRQALADVGAAGPDLAGVAAAWVKGYGETDAAHVRAVAALAALALRNGRREAMDRIVATVNLEAMMESRDACRVLPALAGACAAVEAAAPGAGASAIEAVSRLTGQHTSSAFALARRLPRIAARLPQPAVAAYVAGVQRLIGAAGPRLVGYALDRLPADYRAGVAEGDAVVDDAAAVAARGGTTAAEWFLEGRTAASRG